MTKLLWAKLTDDVANYGLGYSVRFGQDSAFAPVRVHESSSQQRIHDVYGCLDCHAPVRVEADTKSIVDIIFDYRRNLGVPTTGTG